MKAAWLLTTLLLTSAICHAGDTAYQALRLIGGNNQALLNHVIEVQGTKGDPQPLVWRILVDDQSARGGVREMEVSKGRVISEHTPISGYAGTGGVAVMDFKKLNLDSQGAFTIANQEAAKRAVAFDSVDYVLRTDEQSGAPVWVLKLIDSAHLNVGTLYIAADNGAVIRAEGMKAGGSANVAPAPRRDTYVPPDTTGAGVSPVNPVDPDEVPPNERVGYKINKGLHNIGGTLQQFFTGKRTVDKDFQN